VVAAVTLSAPLAASADSYVPSNPCACGSAPITVHDDVATDPSGGGLADTGSYISWPLIGLAGAAVVVGGGAVVVTRRSRRSS
jgi:LPXTG-motif cell wall-anchored protein